MVWLLHTKDVTPHNISARKKKDKELLIKKKEKRGGKGKEKEKKEMLAGFCDYLSEQLYSSLYKSAATDAAAKLTKTYGALWPSSSLCIWKQNSEL